MKLYFDKKFSLRIAKNVFLTVVGTTILAFGAALFIIPFDLVVGGISSIAIIIQKLIPLPFFSVERIIMILAWTLFFIGLFTLGKSFAFKTLISTIIYPFCVSFFSDIVNSDLLGGFFNLNNSQHNEVSVIMASLFGGFFIGTGCAITFLGGGSTGGIDIIAFLLCKHFKRLKSSRAIFYIDAVIIILGIFVIRDLIITLLGIISAFISTMVIDKIFISRSKALIAQIISDKPEEINKEIIEKLNRTTTHIKIIGGYTKEEKTMLIVSFGIRQYADLLNTVNRIDQNAFLTIHQASEINGKGWTK